MMGYDFSGYIRQDDAAQGRERAALWQTAAGLQRVDGLTTSAYLAETAGLHIAGEIGIDEARERISAYYAAQNARKEREDSCEEADRAAAAIAKILAENGFVFSPAGFLSVHRRIFAGIFEHAGTLRPYNISKKEWVLDGASVVYAPHSELMATLEYDLERERAFSYAGLPPESIVSHIAAFTADLWQIHPFCEGNTRTTAVFLIKYLASLGFEANNAPFQEHAWYFRNALARAKYQNIPKGIHKTLQPLVTFFENLLYGAKHPLHNRQIHIRAENGDCAASASQA